MSLFTDDAKLLRQIRNSKTAKIPQKDLNKIWIWSKKWEMKFNVHKCHFMEMGKSERPTWTYSMGDIKWDTSMKVHEERSVSDSTR